MTRVGIVAAVIIIVVAAIFFGFRKAARDHANDDTPVATSAKRSAPAAPVTAETAPTNTGSPPRVRRIDPTARQKLLDQISTARARRGERGESPVGSPSTPTALSKDYIRDQVRALIPLLTECYTRALENDPKIAGKLVVNFAIGGEPEIGGLVEDSEVDPANSTITDAGMIECVRETMYAAEFIAPSEAGRVVVHYPFEFSNDK